MEYLTQSAKCVYDSVFDFEEVLTFCGFVLMMSMKLLLFFVVVVVVVVLCPLFLLRRSNFDANACRQPYHDGNQFSNQNLRREFQCGEQGRGNQ